MGSPFAFRIHIVPWIDAQHIPQFLTTGILVVEESASNSTSLWRPTHGRLESWLPELATLLEVVALRQLALPEVAGQHRVAVTIHAIGEGLARRPGGGRCALLSPTQELPMPRKGTAG